MVVPPWGLDQLDTALIACGDVHAGGVKAQLLADGLEQALSPARGSVGVLDDAAGPRHLPAPGRCGDSSSMSELPREKLRYLQPYMIGGRRRIACGPPSAPDFVAGTPPSRASACHGQWNRPQTAASSLNEFGHRNLLHLGDAIADLLVRGHEGARPGRRVLDEGTGKGLAAAVGEADGVGNTGIRYAGHVVDLRQPSPGDLVPGHDLTVAVAHHLDVDALVIGVGITVVGPQECADAHLARRGVGLAPRR